MDEITPLSQEKCLYFALVLISMQIYALVYCKVMRYNVKSSRAGKGQLNSEWIYEFIVSPKMPTKNFPDFCPGSLWQKSGKILVGILGETMTS